MRDDQLLLCPCMSLSVPFVMEKFPAPGAPDCFPPSTASRMLLQINLGQVERDRFSVIFRFISELWEIQGVLQEVRNVLPPVPGITPSSHPVLQGTRVVF